MKLIISLISIMLLFSTNLLLAKQVDEYFIDIEALLMENKISEANKSYINLPEEIKFKSIQVGDRYKYVDSLYFKTIRWIENINEINQLMYKVERNKEGFNAKKNDSISQRKCKRNCTNIYRYSISLNFPKSLPFSTKFSNYLNQVKEKTLTKFDLLTHQIIDAKEQKRKAQRVKTENERNKRIEEARTKQKRKEEQKKKALKKEEQRLDKIAKANGFSGYINKLPIAVLYKTQRDGGLEKYVNVVIGCNKLNDQDWCKRGSKFLRILQVLDDGLLYSYSEYNKVEKRYVNIMVYTDREAGKLYQEGQPFENKMYVFVGMVSYIATNGAKKTVPYMKRVKLL